jgi:hypothetical protein
MASPEQHTHSPEHTGNSKELEKIGEKQKEILRSKLDHAAEKHEAKGDVHHDAVNKAESKATIQSREARSPAERRSPITKHQREASFQAQLSTAQSDMHPAEKVFSKVIHNKTVEKVSDVAAASIARPNALLAGSIFAFIAVTAVYLVAKNYGYPLSGFETIGAFIVGWIAGVLYDYFRIMITGKK